MTSTDFLPPIVLDFLWETLDAGELPYPLRLRSHGGTVDEREQLRRRVFDDLRSHDLVDGQGRIAPRLEDRLMLLARAEHSIDSVFQRGVGADAAGSVLSVLAVGDGQRGVLAIQDDSGLTLRGIEPDALASSVVGLLPSAKRGSTQSITLPSEELSALSGGRTVGRSTTDRDALAKLVEQRKLRAGQLAVNARSQMGGRSRSPVLSWFDTDVGRYLTYARKGADGHDWITIAPADAATLRHQLGEMLTTLTR